MTVLRTDPRVVARLAKDLEDENWEFRSFLKNLDMETADMDAIVHRIHREVADAIDCTLCAQCCRAMPTTVQAPDLKRLAGGLGLTERETIDRYLVPDEENPGAHVFHATPCPLLSDGRCTAYESRPDECREYPHLDKDGFVFRLIGVVHNCSVCPIVFNVVERLKEELWPGRAAPRPT